MSFTPIDFYDAREDTLDNPTLEDRELKMIELCGSAAARSGGAMLDIGCGRGNFLAAIDERYRLRDRGWDVRGIDFSPHEVERASARGFSVEQANVEEGLRFEDETFDLVYAGELIEHLYDPDSFLAECRRVLKRDGYLALTTPNLLAWYNRALFLLGIQPLFHETSTQSTAIGAGPVRRFKRGSVPVGHIRVLNRTAIVDLLKSQGLRPIQIRGAAFESFPAPLRRLDRIVANRATLASNLVVLARVTP